MPKRGQVIFVVDDEAIIAQSLAAILNNAGFQATAFDRPDKAIAACNEASPDLLISDVKMPQMTGIELGIHFRKTQPRCRVFLFSGSACTEDLLQEAHKRGYDFDPLWKPIHPADLLAKIRS